MKKLFILSLLSSFFLFSPAQAQFNLGYRLFDSIPVIENGNTLNMAWVGGFNYPQFSEIDLNGDNIMDLFVFDREGNSIKTFLNAGTANQVSYTHAPEYEDDFPILSDFVLLRDYNCDGKQDIFSYAPGGFKVFRNVSTTGLSFSLETDLLLADYFGFNISNAYIIPNDVPIIDDLDNDGDLDIISFGIGSTKNTMVYYRNLSMDDFGTCDSLKYEFASECWGNVVEPSISQFFQPSFCKGGASSGGGISSSLRGHPGSTMLAVDMDDDNDKDLIIGDIAHSNLLYIENIGDNNTASFDTATQTTDFPFNTTFANLGMMPAPYGVDVNNDGAQDLLVASNNTIDTGGYNLENAWYYKNEGTTTLPDYKFQTETFLSGGMIDLGAGAHPAFLDVNGDGDLDLLVGYDHRRSSNGEEFGAIAYYENVGAFSFAPEFELVTLDYSGIEALNLFTIHPTLGDLDGDGDLDMIIGDDQGFLHYFQNDPVNDSAVFTMQQPANYMSIDVSFAATPQLVDLNGDTLLDLLVGEQRGFLKYYENQGSSTVAQFDSVPNIDTLGGIIMKGGFNGFTSPFYTSSLDSMGTKVIALGTFRGNILVYDSVENNLNGNFRLVDSIVTSGSRLHMTGADIFGDGKMDLLVGQKTGGLRFFTRTQNIRIGIPEGKTLVDQIKLFPNPTRDQLTIDLRANYASDVQLEVVDLLGKKALTQRNNLVEGANYLQLDVSSLAEGLYFLQIHNGASTVSQKFVVSKGY